MAAIMPEIGAIGQWIEAVRRRIFRANVLIAQHGADGVKYKKEKSEMLLAPVAGYFSHQDCG
jgi:hypothetical protein